MDTAHALDAAELRGTLQRLPDGLQTVIGEAGSKLSGGEGQRVRFARALLRPNVRLALLDEPFRGLDRGTRRALIARARARWSTATLVCVTHDLEETQDFDEVIVVERGMVCESGPPAQLRARPGSRYAELLAAEQRVLSARWQGVAWRQVCVDGGKVHA
jgi:ATP-binding cassette subfamily B protein